MADKRPRKPGVSGNRFTQKRKEIYLAELRRTGLKPDARLAANVQAATVNRHRQKDSEFSDAEANALVTYCRIIEDEIQRRGIEGVARPVTVAGEREMIRDYSDSLLIRLAKRHIPEYRDQIKIDQKTEVTGSLALEADLSKFDTRGRKLLRELLSCEVEESDEDGETTE